MGGRSHIIIFITIVIVNSVRHVTSSDSFEQNIPRYLEECYSKPSLRNRASRLPATMGTLISLLQKAERDEHTEQYTTKVGGVLDATVMAYSMLHRFRLDGIERVTHVSSNLGQDYEEDAEVNGTTVNIWKGLIPYSPSGFQFNRFKILFSKLIPGNAVLFPNATLKPHEKCAMHFMLSSTLEMNERGDESSTCPLKATTKPTLPNTPSECPLEGGVVAVHTPYSLRADTVSPGTVIAGIAAALQHQTVPLPRLLDQTDSSGGQVTNRPNFGNPVFHDIPRAPSVQNTWAATLAGDLSEVAIFQAPYKLKLPSKARETISAELRIGAEGWWGGGPNSSSPSTASDIYTVDSRVAKWYYLKRNTNLEMTDAEIRGGIDGLLLGSGILRWRESAKGRLRLSQILEMYYSEKGMAAYGEPEMKWCNRMENFLRGSLSTGNENNMDVLLSQTMAFSQVLYKNVFQPIKVDDELMQDFVQISVQEFYRYLTTDIDDQHCADGYYGEDHEFKGYPRADIHVVTDGSWIGHNFTQFMAYLSEECDVSLFGSRMSIMHGRSGNWIVKDAKSSAEVIYNVSREVSKWKGKPPPSASLDLKLILAKLEQHVHHKEEIERRRFVAKGIRPMVILFLAHGYSLLSTDAARMEMGRFLGNNTDVHVFFASEDSVKDLFTGLGVQLIRTADSRPEIMVPEVLDKLRKVPGRIIASNCNGRSVRRTDIGTRGNSSSINGNLELEDYVSLGQDKTYRFHPSYFKNTREGTIEFVGSGYGEMTICMTRYRPDEPRRAAGQQLTECQQLIDSSVKFVFLDACPGGEPYSGDCLPIYFTLNVTKSYNRCTEDDCRFPDQVRFSLWQQGFKCSSADRGCNPSFFLLILALIVALHTSIK